jgi:hypothetical protein
MSVAKYRGIIFLGLPRIRVNKELKIHFLEIRPLFRPFLYKICQNLKIRPEIYPAALLFIRPFLTYAAEKSPVGNTDPDTRNGRHFENGGRV